MNERDVIRKMGRFPDKIIPYDSPERMTAHIWGCARCDNERSFTYASPAPSIPCECGCVFWRVVAK